MAIIERVIESLEIVRRASVPFRLTEALAEKYISICMYLDTRCDYIYTVKTVLLLYQFC
jgi:hypothetical protein